MTKAEQARFRQEFQRARDDVKAWPRELQEAAQKTGVLARPAAKETP